MVDNIDVDPGTTASKVPVATDEIGSTHYQIIKIAVGADGVANLASSANPVPTTTVVTTLPALVAGTANIGDVDVLTVPTDPFGANADAASATGSISAKLKAIATATGITAFTRGAGVVDSNTLRVTIDSSQTEGAEYDAVAASTTEVLGATGAAGDYISHILVVPATTSPGSIALLDGATSYTVFTGGASSVSNLVPFTITCGMTALGAGWSITTGSNVSVIAVGNFT